MGNRNAISVFAGWLLFLSISACAPPVTIHPEPTAASPTETSGALRQSTQTPPPVEPIVETELPNQTPETTISSTPPTFADAGTSVYQLAIQEGGHIFSGGHVWLSSLDGLVRTRVTSHADVDAILGWSPDNTQLAIQVHQRPSSGFEGFDIGVIDLRTGLITEVVDLETHPYGVFWHSDQTLALVREEGIEIVSISDGRVQELLPLPKRDFAAASFAFSPDFQWLAYTIVCDCPGSDYHLYAFNLTTRLGGKVIPEGYVEYQAWIGDKLLYSFTQGDSELLAISPDGSDKRRLAVV